MNEKNEFKPYIPADKVTPEITVTSVIMGVLCVPSNYFITYPIYTKLMPLEQILGLYKEIFPKAGGLLSCLIMFNMPFTMLKGVICSIITFMIYKRLSPVIKGR